MAVALSLSTRAAALDAIGTAIQVGAGTANLTVYQTNTALCVFPLAATPLSTAVGGSAAVAGCPISSTGTEVAGKANRLVLTNEDGDTVLTGTISAIGGGGDIETESLTVTAATTQTLNAFVFRMATGGGLTIEGSLTLV